MILSFSWLETLNVRNRTNGNSVARLFGILFWNEINPGFCFLFIRPGFWSEERQKCFIFFSFWEEESEGKVFG